MSGDWKPGDVGINTTNERFIVTGRGQCYWPGEGPAAMVVGVSGVPDDTDRPLVVIDPEDTEQVDRFASLIFECGMPDTCAQPARCMRDRIRAALREFANPTPPKPDEPTGLGAVVEDARGRRFTRACTCDNDDSKDWRAERQEEGTPNHHWNDIEAVRVLSEGIS